MSHRNCRIKKNDFPNKMVEPVTFQTNCSNSKHTAMFRTNLIIFHTNLQIPKQISKNSKQALFELFLFEGLSHTGKDCDACVDDC